MWSTTSVARETPIARHPSHSGCASLKRADAVSQRASYPRLRAPGRSIMVAETLKGCARISAGTGEILALPNDPNFLISRQETWSVQLAPHATTPDFFELHRLNQCLTCLD